MAKDIAEDIILMPEFTFPQHHLISTWLNGTEYHKYFDLVLCQVETETSQGSKRVSTVPGLAIKGAAKKGKFYWELKGGADALTQKVLDFKPDRVL
jgi:hypothetical protein